MYREGVGCQDFVHGIIHEGNDACDLPICSETQLVIQLRGYAKMMFMLTGGYLEERRNVMMAT
jgi:hypothetical protein